MNSNWQRWCQGKQLRVVADGVEVRFASGRAHVVRVVEADSAYHFSARVGAADDLPAYASAQDLWQHNRGLALAGLHLDRQGQVTVRSWVPKAGLSADEFRSVLAHVAREADQLEHRLTGTDDF